MKTYLITIELEVESEDEGQAKQDAIAYLQELLDDDNLSMKVKPLS